MKRFEYQAIDKDGKVVRGIVEAKNFEGLLRFLFEKRLHPIDVQTLTKAGAEISRLKQFAQKIEGVTPESPKEFEFKKMTQEPQPPKSKVQIDWSYLLYISIIVGLIAAAAVNLN